jgi:hypothetical protein
LGKSWTRLHRLVYLAGILVIIHYVWLVKSDIRIPLLYGLIVLVLLIARVKPVRKALSRFRQSSSLRRMKLAERFRFPNTKDKPEPDNSTNPTLFQPDSGE